MATDRQDHCLAVLGGGVMGTGISALALGHGIPVVLVEVDEDAGRRAEASIAGQLRHGRLMRAFPDVPEGELVTTTKIAGISEATAVIEAVTEAPAVKAEVLGEASATVRPGTPLISNTSGIPIDEMAAWVVRGDELIGTHFMNPPYLIAMAEVIRGRRTGERTLEQVTGLLAALGRRPVVVRDAPGFVTSRLLHPMINRAVAIVAAGTASVKDVDALMEGCLGHPTGPLRTADLIGLDNLVDSLNALYERTGDPSCRPCELLLEKVSEGSLGRKSGRGFYEYGKVPS